MNNPLDVSPSKGNQGTTRGKEKIFWPRWESNPRPPDLIYRYSADWATRSDRESRGRFRWLFMGLISTKIYISELILCSIICVHNATRHNIHMYPYFLFAAIYRLNRPRLSLSDLVAQSAE